MIYLDNAATSKVFVEAKELMCKYLDEEFFNPSSLYGASLTVKNDIEDARKNIAEIFCCQKSEIYFTSCATESNNWVLNCGKKYKKGNIVTTLGEHPSVFETANALKSRGEDVRFAGLTASGDVDSEDLFKKIDSETALVSIIHCSNETGAINNLKNLVSKIRSIAPRALIHSDGVQAFCKIKTNLKDIGVDFYSVSAHKIGGAKGVGALYINKNINIQPFIFGGGQEGGQRSGTENTAGIMCFSKAAQIYKDLDKGKAKELRAYMLKSLQAIPNIIFNQSTADQSDYIISASISGIRGEILQHILSDEGILIGLGSACSSRSRQNRVLSAIGRTGKEIEGSIRISFSPENTMEEITHAAKTIVEKILELKEKLL